MFNISKFLTVTLCSFMLSACATTSMQKNTELLKSYAKNLKASWDDPDGSKNFTTGLYYHNQGDYTKAIEYYEKSAAQNNMTAYHNLFVLYKSDLKDDQKAFYWAEQGANKGFPSLQITLSTFYLEKTSAHADGDKAIYWLTQAAKNKKDIKESERAKYLLGILYISGDSTIPQDVHKGLAMLDEFATRGDAKANTIIAETLYKNRKTFGNIDQVFTLYTKSANKGDVIAQHSLGILYSCPHLGREPDYHSSKKWFQQACLNGNQDSCGRYQELQSAGF